MGATDPGHRTSIANGTILAGTQNSVSDVRMTNAAIQAAKHRRFFEINKANAGEVGYWALSLVTLVDDFNPIRVLVLRGDVVRQCDWVVAIGHRLLLINDGHGLEHAEYRWARNAPGDLEDVILRRASTGMGSVVGAGFTQVDVAA